MEPADERRDDDPGMLLDHLKNRFAAMEPADERRDDLLIALPPEVADSSPQWSPPMNGGTTGDLQKRGYAHTLAAMEPADERRDDQLQ